jgi:hypothetical protein
MLGKVAAGKRIDDSYRRGGFGKNMIRDILLGKVFSVATQRQL